MSYLAVPYEYTFVEFQDNQSRTENYFTIEFHNLNRSSEGNYFTSAIFSFSKIVTILNDTSGV